VTDRDRARVARLLRRSWPRHVPHRRPRPQPALRLASGESEPGMPLSETRSSPQEESGTLQLGYPGIEPPLLVVHLGAGTQAKRWPMAHWNTLIGRFLDDGWRIGIVGGAEDAQRAASLASHPNLRDWTGQLAVTETAALLERAELFIGADSGPAHLAACARTTSVVLFSGTNLVSQWRPWSRRSVVLRHRVDCHPCHRKLCPLAGHPCLSGITPDRVHRLASRWWSRMNQAEAPHVPLG
jgi:ADP-heptose:LPS heptosyltransferase